MNTGSEILLSLRNLHKTVINIPTLKEFDGRGTELLLQISVAPEKEGQGAGAKQSLDRTR